MNKLKVIPYNGNFAIEGSVTTRVETKEPFRFRHLYSERQVIDIAYAEHREVYQVLKSNAFRMGWCTIYWPTVEAAQAYIDSCDDWVMSR